MFFVSPRKKTFSICLTHVICLLKSIFAFPFGGIVSLQSTHFIRAPESGIEINKSIVSKTIAQRRFILFVMKSIWQQCGSALLIVQLRIALIACFKITVKKRRRLNKDKSNWMGATGWDKRSKWMRDEGAHKQIINIKMSTKNTNITKSLMMECGDAHKRKGGREFAWNAL